VGAERNWYEVVQRLLSGDELAYLELARLVNRFLGSWRAYDFADEWEDVIQDVVTATALAVREGRVREVEALPGYVRAVTRNQLGKRLERRLRAGRDALLPWDETIVGRHLERSVVSLELRVDLLAALDKLPERKREVVWGVYVAGRTYDQGARDSGIPLGTLKRYLRDGLAQLREQFGAQLDAEGPSEGAEA
jgi:RNA polymerase sigma-70 factor (ECF subfamily)